MKVRILEFNIDDITMEQVLIRIEEFIRNGMQHRVTYANPYCLLQAGKLPELKAFINKADIVIPDGFGVILAGRLLGKSLRGRIVGTDLIDILSKLAVLKGWRMYFLGAEDGIAKKAAGVLQEKYRGLKVVGVHHGYFSMEEEDMVVKDIIEKKPDILIVCMGVGKQEMFIERNFQRLNVSVSFGNGAAFDFVAGKFKRAPYWMQKYGLEWLYRLIQEPGRLWKRYLIGNVVFIGLILKDVFKKKEY